MKKREISLVEFRLDHENRIIYRRFMKVTESRIVGVNNIPAKTVRYREVSRKLNKVQWNAFIKDTKQEIRVDENGTVWSKVPKYSNLMYYKEGMQGFIPMVNLIALKRDYPDGYEQIDLFDSN